jgi:ankyrin repeat protein
VEKRGVSTENRHIASQSNTVQNMSASAHELHLVAQEGDVEEIRRLVHEEGFSVDSRCALGFTALHMAVFFKNLGAMRQLVELGGDLSAQNVNGTTPLIIAAMSRVLYPSNYLLDSRASPNQRDYFGGTALLKATKHDTHSAALLLQRRADPSLANHAGKSPLYYAVRNKNHKLVQVLIDANADVNRRTEKGITVLHMAVRADNPFAVRQLCSAGADVHAVCGQGHTAV